MLISQKGEALAAENDNQRKRKLLSFPEKRNERKCISLFLSEIHPCSEESLGIENYRAHNVLHDHSNQADHPIKQCDDDDEGALIFESQDIATR